MAYTGILAYWKIVKNNLFCNNSSVYFVMFASEILHDWAILWHFGNFVTFLWILWYSWGFFTSAIFDGYKSYFITFFQIFWWYNIFWQYYGFFFRFLKSYLTILRHFGWQHFQRFYDIMEIFAIFWRFYDICNFVNIFVIKKIVFYGHILALAFFRILRNFWLYVFYFFKVLCFFF